MTTATGLARGPKFLVVDDDDRFRERLSLALLKRGYDVRAVASGAQALDCATEFRPAFALVDLRLPGEWGLHVVRDLLCLNPATRIVVLTAYGSIATAIEAVRIGAVSYLQKPASLDEIEQSFQTADLVTSGPALEPMQVPSLAKAEWEHINRVLTECDGNIRKAARLLGLHRRTLQRKLAKFPAPR